MESAAYIKSCAKNLVFTLAGPVQKPLLCMKFKASVNFLPDNLPHK
jgi:hypothetical protein